MQNEDSTLPHDHARDTGLKIIGAGFGRTGTASLKAALEMLGLGPCYHMWEVIGRPERIAQWESIISGEPPDWAAVFAGYQATVDWPACAYYKQLMDAYPDAKVLLTVRDPDRWYDSVRATIYRTREVTRQLESGAASPESFGQEFVWHVQMVTELIWRRTFDDRFEDRAHALEVVRRHNEEVQRRVPADRLLVYDVSEGWAPLCAFLDVAVPADQAFPRVNDRAAFQARIEDRAQPVAAPEAGTSEERS